MSGGDDQGKVLPFRSRRAAVEPSVSQLIAAGAEQAQALGAELERLTQKLLRREVPGGSQAWHHLGIAEGHARSAALLATRSSAAVGKESQRVVGALVAALLAILDEAQKELQAATQAATEGR